MTLHQVFEKSIGLPPWFMDLAAGVVIANRMPGPAVRLALVGERKSGIEEVIESLSGLKDVLPFDSFTPGRSPLR